MRFPSWWYALPTQPNAWIHAVAFVAVLTIAVWARLGRIEGAILIFTVALVWAAKFVNTAVNELCRAPLQRHRFW